MPNVRSNAGSGVGLNSAYHVLAPRALPDVDRQALAAVVLEQRKCAQTPPVEMTSGFAG